MYVQYCMNVYLLTTQWHQPACHTSFWLDELVYKWVIAAAMELEDELEAVKWWWIKTNMMI